MTIGERPDLQPVSRKIASTSLFLLSAAMLAAVSAPVRARTVWRCVRDGTVSLSTAPEPDSKSIEKALDDAAPTLPNLWGSLGTFRGTLYQREQDGKIVYGTRKLPGSIPMQQFTVATPASSPAHIGLGKIGRPQIGIYRREFAKAAAKTGLDEAWLRTIAHAESDYVADAVSVKGAKGVMQLMPQTIGDYAVTDAFSAQQSILAGARYLKTLEAMYAGDRVLTAAAYNSGPAAVAEYGGVPPYSETRLYVAKVKALYERYRQALGLAPRSLELAPAP